MSLMMEDDRVVPEIDTNDNRTWDDLNTDLDLNYDDTEEWGPDYPKEDE